MYRKTDLILFTLFSFLLIAGGCSLTSGPSDADSLDNEFLSFQILTSDNPGLTTSITGRLTETEILLETTDTTAPDYLVPRYETGAVSVEVNGDAQENGVSAQDFTNTVTYTLTDKAGNVRQYDARLMLGSGWFDLGATVPLLGAGSVVYDLKSGVMNTIIPYVVCYDGAGDLQTFLFNSINDDWDPYDVGQPVVTNDYDAIPWNGSLWVVYENGGSLFADSSLPPDTWNGAAFITATAGTWDLKIVKSSEDRFFAGWIEDPVGIQDVYVWKYDGAWNMLPLPDTSFSYSEMELVAAGGDKLYLTCLLEEAPGVIHLFEYDGGTWSMTIDGGSSPYRDDGIVFKEMFYDTEKQTPVLFAAFPNASGEYSLRALYWNLDGSSGIWSDFHPSGNGISAINLSAAELDGLSLNWNDNKVTAVIGNNVKYFSNGTWMDLGYSFDSFVPGASAVTVFSEDVAIVSYIDNPLTDALYVKVKQ